MKLVKLGYSVWKNILSLVAVIALFMVITGIHPHTDVKPGPNRYGPVASKQVEWDACHRLLVDSHSLCWVEYKSEHDARVRRPR